MSAAEKRRMKKHKLAGSCNGSISAASNSWIENSGSLHNVFFLTSALVSKMSVTDAQRAAECGKLTAVDYYGMCRDVT